MKKVLLVAIVLLFAVVAWSQSITPPRVIGDLGPAVRALISKADSQEREISSLKAEIAAIKLKLP